MTWQAQNSFTGGEVSPRLYGRNDLDQYRNSVALLENFIIHPHGGISRRSGTRFIVEVKDSDKATRVIPFEASIENSYCVEVGDLYMRFIKDGAQLESAPSTPVELVTTYTEAQLFDLQFAQIADTMWIVHPAHTPRKLTRASDTSWALTDETFVDGPYLPLNTTDTKLYATALVPAAYNAGTTYAEGESVSYGGKDYYSLVSGNTGNQPDISPAFWGEYTSAQTVTASSVEGINGGLGFQSGDIDRMIRVYDGSAWVWGAITGVTDTLNVSFDVVSAGTFPVTPGTDVWRFGKWSTTTGWPSVVTFYEQRIAYAGSPGSPQDVDLSQTDDYSNFASTALDGTVVASDACNFTVAADRLNAVQWMLPARGLDIGTSGGEWVLSGGGDPLAPANVDAIRYTNVGGSNIRPVHVGNVGLFVARGGRAVHEYAFVFQDDAYNSPDLNLLTDHLLRGTTIVDMDHSPSSSVVWCVRSDGLMIALTYMRDQGVVGWHRHSTDGLFESVCTVPEGARDVPYFVVQRVIDGSSVRYIEYLETEYVGTDLSTAYFVDCGDTYTPVGTTVSGLDHLEGETVTVLADGMVVAGLVVASGEITLPRAATSAQVGMQFISNMNTLPIENAALEDGTSMGRVKTLSQIVAKFTDTYGGKGGPDADNLDEFIWNEDLVYGEAPVQFSGEKELSFGPGHDTDKRVYIRQDLPFPMTTNALTIEYTVTQR